MKGTTKRFTYELDKVFTVQIPYLVEALFVDEFTGASNTCFLQFGGPNEVLTRQTIEHSKSWDWRESREVWLVNTTAQAGKTLIIGLGEAGSSVSGTPTVDVQLADTTGALVNPATEDKQDDEITKLTSLDAAIGEVQAAPTENTVLERLKVLETGLSSLNTAVGNVEIAIDETPKSAVTPTLYNVTITNANTEYSQALPANTRRFSVHLRDYAAFRLAYVTGKVAAPTAPYLSVPLGAELSQENLLSSAITLYFASAVAAKVAEIEVWT